MIKEQSFEWLLEGCHRIADVAVAYYPRTDRHPPELLGDARPREGYDREKSVSSGL